MSDLDDDVDEVEDDPLHPRFRQRRAEVAVASLRQRNRKLLAAGAVILLALLAYASTQSPLFDVDEVRVIGAQRTSPEYFREVANVELGAPILGLNTDLIEGRLLLLPQVRDVLARASWDGVVTIEVNERLPVARIESTDGMVIIADDGLVLDVILAPEPLDIENAEATDGTEDAPGAADDLPGVAAELPQLPPDLLALPEISGAIFSIDVGELVPNVLGDPLIVANEMPEDIATITERIEITVDSLVLRVVGGGSISLGDARELDEKFDAVRAFLGQVDLSCLDTLNVSAPSVPVIVRNTGC